MPRNNIKCSLVVTTRTTGWYFDDQVLMWFTWMFLALLWPWLWSHDLENLTSSSNWNRVLYVRSFLSLSSHSKDTGVPTFFTFDFVAILTLTPWLSVHLSLELQSSTKVWWSALVCKISCCRLPCTASIIISHRCCIRLSTRDRLIHDSQCR